VLGRATTTLCRIGGLDCLPVARDEHLGATVGEDIDADFLVPVKWGSTHLVRVRKAGPGDGF
jgi:hypothetical protein